MPRQQAHWGPTQVPAPFVRQNQNRWLGAGVMRAALHQSKHVIVVLVTIMAQLSLVSEAQIGADLEGTAASPALSSQAVDAPCHCQCPARDGLPEAEALVAIFVLRGLSKAKSVAPFRHPASVPSAPTWHLCCCRPQSAQDLPQSLKLPEQLHRSAWW